MGGRLCFGVLAAFLLIYVAVGVRDAAAVGGRRVVTAKKEGERSGAGQGAAAPPAEGSRSVSSSVPKDSAPPVTSSDSKPAAGAPPNPPAAPPVSSKLPNSAPAAPVSGIPSRPPPAPGIPVNPLPSSSGSPLNKPPPSGGPPPKSPASEERSHPSPVSVNHPATPESKLPKPAPSGHGREAPTSGKDGKEKEKKQQPGTSPNPDSSQGKGQATEKCNVPVPHRCHVNGLLACLRQSENGAQKWFLLVQNEGENSLEVKILGSSSVKLDKSISLPVSLPPHKASKINIQVDAVEGQNIFLETGNGNCTLHMSEQSSTGSFFQQFPNYANHVTPIHGVYLASLTVIFIGGTWACCRFRKRRRVDAGVAYQQLEMGTQQQSSNALDDEGSANGWDDGWNDDWDDEEAAPRPPEKRESASQNGVAFKSSEKNEWEDWDD